jgi:hypothetical protein
VLLTKNQILGANKVAPKAASVGWLSRALKGIASLDSQRQLAYSFAAILLIFAGITGLAVNLLPTGTPVSVAVKNIVEKSTASLTPEANVKNKVADFTKKSQDLAAALKSAKGNSKTSIPVAINAVKDAAKSLTDAIVKDPASAKEVALQVKESATLLSVNGSADLKETSDLLYKTIDDQMIADLNKTTLTESQQQDLVKITDLYNQGKYSDVLEAILLINQSK